MNNSNLTSLAKTLRKQMTEAERLLWYTFLRRYPQRFYRQRVIDNYIVDFYCSAARLVIEIDGSQHYESEGIRKDEIRTMVLEEKGLLVLRIPNNEVKNNLKGVCEYIDRVVQERTRSKRI